MPILSKVPYKRIADIYLMYPYKCWDFNSTTIPKPYVPKEEVVCGHQFSLTYKEFKTIIMVYLNYLKQYLLDGNEFKMPQMLGYLEFVKYKGRAVDYGHFHNNNKEIKLYINKHSEGYRPKLMWKRRQKDARLRYRWSWRMRPCTRFRNLIGKRIKEDLTFFQRLNTKT